MKNQPNILFLFSDEHTFRGMGHRPAELGGEPLFTPTFDRLASQGTVFQNAYCQMPLCTPSRLCLLSGKEVMGAGAWSNCSVFRPENVSLPQTLAHAGYTTALVGKMHFGGNRQFNGFQYRPYGDLTGACGHQWEPIQEYPGNKTMRVRTTGSGVSDIPESLLQDQVVAHETVAFIREQMAANAEKPWFVTASFSRPHFPLTAPKRWINYYQERIQPPAVGATGDAWDHPMSAGMRKGFRVDAIDDDEMMQARLGYWACISYLDEVIGDLLARLERDRMLDNTIIVYTSDHGEMAGEHGVWWKHGWYEACTHVPFIVSTPEQRQGTVPAMEKETPIGLIDLYPTLAELAGADTPEDLDGCSFASALRSDEEPVSRPIVVDNLEPRWGAGTEFRCVRLGRFKYVRFRDADPLFFDLEADPEELYNLLQRGMTAEQSAACDEMMAFVSKSMDFDLAEQLRIERDKPLRETYALAKNDHAYGNQYLRRDGMLVSVESALYDPYVITDEPTAFFSDFPQN